MHAQVILHDPSSSTVNVQRGFSEVVIVPDPSQANRLELLPRCPSKILMHIFGVALSSSESGIAALLGQPSALMDRTSSYELMCAR